MYLLRISAELRLRFYRGFSFLEFFQSNDGRVPNTSRPPLSKSLPTHYSWSFSHLIRHFVTHADKTTLIYTLRISMSQWGKFYAQNSFNGSKKYTKNDRSKHRASRSAFCLLHAGFLLGLLFCPKDEDNMYLGKVGWLSVGQLLLVLASIVILGSESRGAHDHILLTHCSGSRAAPSFIGWFSSDYTALYPRRWNALF
jgi:hypothetical protein